MERLKEKLKSNAKVYKVYTNIKNGIFGDPKKREIKSMIDYYTERFEKYSGCFHKSVTSEMAYLTWLYHIIEKGLAMPNMKKGFGKDRLVELLDLIERLETLGENITQSKAFESAIATIKEYKSVHQAQNYTLDTQIDKRIDAICSRYMNIKPLKQKVWSRYDYCNQFVSNFSEFAASRHSVRHFDKTSDIKTSDIVKALETAVLAPSACNRQPSRVHIIETPDLIEKCIRLQNGNRGFGHLTNKLLVVTGNLGTVLLPQEFFDLYTNVGIFIMNLSYALHEQKIAHCILNWYASPDIDGKLRSILDLPDEENVVAFIICGKVPEYFKVVCSPRNSVEDVYDIH